jgi:hypothetical protein
MSKEIRLKAECNTVFLYCDCGGFTAPTGYSKMDNDTNTLYGNKCDVCHKIIWTKEQYPYTEIIYFDGDVKKVEIEKCKMIEDGWREVEYERITKNWD